MALNPKSCRKSHLRHIFLTTQQYHRTHDWHDGRNCLDIYLQCYTCTCIDMIINDLHWLVIWLVLPRSWLSQLQWNIYFKNKIVEKEPHCCKYIALYSNFSCSPLLIETKFVPCIPLNSLAWSHGNTSYLHETVNSLLWHAPHLAC